MEAEKRIKRIKLASSAGAAKSELSINDLDDDSLGIIFNKLPYRDRVGIESVCKRWRDVSKLNWGTYSKHLRIVKNTDIYPPFHNKTPEKNKNILEKVLERRGRYLEEISFSLDVNFCQNFKAGTIKRIVECCPKLVRLTIGTQELNAEDVYACSNLEGLTLGFAFSLHTGSFRELLRRNKRLRRLQICLSIINTSDFDHLEPGQLEILHVDFCLAFQLSAGLADKLAESLVELNYTDKWPQRDALHHISKLKNLRFLMLNLQCTRLETQFIVEIAKNCQKLERITLHTVTEDKINLNFIPLLFNMPCLKSLVIVPDKYEVPYEEIDRLFRQAPSLKFFVLNSCTKCNYEEANINPCDRHLNSLVINAVASHTNEAVIMTAA